uniref:Protein kinase domain-containing protein n=1 Tax=Heterorhabditis bacteriophora TaxID=37862 RepID=A0A1I7WD68_HETBA
MAELMLGKPLFPGESAIDQIVEIIKIDFKDICKVFVPHIFQPMSWEKEMPNGELMPRLFDWLEKEVDIRPDLNRKIFPKTSDVEDCSETNKLTYCE